MSSREKALQFAKNVPRPRAMKRDITDTTDQSIYQNPASEYNPMSLEDQSVRP